MVNIRVWEYLAHTRRFFAGRHGKLSGYLTLPEPYIIL